MNPQGVDRETRAIIRKAREAGWTVDWTKSQHVKLTSPTGYVYYTAGTTSDRRSHKNLRAALRRAGLNL